MNGLLPIIEKSIIQIFAIFFIQVDGNVTVWDVESYQSPTAVLDKHRSQISAVANATKQVPAAVNIWIPGIRKTGRIQNPDFSVSNVCHEIFLIYMYSRGSLSVPLVVLG